MTTAMFAGQPWRLLTTPPGDGATNMAIDHALAQLHAQGLTPPTLRLYRWSPPCLSIGAFQPLAAEVAREECRALGIELVRRPTGGRAILHDQELTYALVASVEHPLVSGMVLESYRKISAALVAGLRRMGVEATLAPEPAAGTQKSAACFDLPSAHEVTVGARKILGSAQTRRQGVLLQHGSLLLSASPELLARCLRLPEGLSAAVLRERVVGLDELLGRPVTFDEVAAAVVQGFRQSWGIELCPGELSADERALAGTLRAERYAAEEWTSRR